MIGAVVFYCFVAVVLPAIVATITVKYSDNRQKRKR